jgi:mannan endo-1,4-beta-mannosidase
MSRRRWKAGLVTWVLVATAAGAFVLGVGRTSNIRDIRPRPLAPPVPTTQPDPVDPLFFGVATPSGPHNFAELDSFVAAAGRKPHVFMFSQDWTSGSFRPELFDAIVRRRMMPMISWEPRDHRVQEGFGSPAKDQPEYTLSRIVDGEWDDYIRQSARQLRSLRYPVSIRFAQQMNGDWFPWSEKVNGNHAGQYVAAWRHIRNIFDQEGASNVTWVWSPNVCYTGSASLQDLYPGDQFVDWIGIDGYNGGAALPWGGWQSPDQLYLPTVRELRTITKKPLVLTEVASTEVGGSKADWIKDLFSMLERERDIIGFIWVEAQREADWRVVSSPGARTAFSTGVAGARFSAMSVEQLPTSRR